MKTTENTKWTKVWNKEKKNQKEEDKYIQKLKLQKILNTENTTKTSEIQVSLLRSRDVLKLNLLVFINISLKRFPDFQPTKLKRNYQNMKKTN